MTHSIPILMYHKIGASVHQADDRRYNVSAHAFARQMRLLSHWKFRGVTVSQLVDAQRCGDALPPRAVVVTFDDAFTGVAEHAAPVLRALDWPATVYVPTACVGRTNQWDAAQGLPQLPLLEWNALRVLQAQGWEMGAHTRTHRNLAGAEDDEAQQEITGSRDDLMRALEMSPRTFSYPYGAMSPHTQALVRAAGFSGACGTRYGLFRPGDDIFALPRVHIGYRYGVWGLLYSLWVGPRLGKPLSG